MKSFVIAIGLLLMLTTRMAFSQTATEKAAIKAQVDSIQNHSASILSILNSMNPPANWKDLVAAELKMIRAGAELTTTTVQNMVVEDGNTVVPAGANLQTYLDNAMPGDTLVLEAGATYKGNFILRNKQGDSWITITSSRLQELPAAGMRVRPSDATLMPKIVSPNAMAAIAAAPGAHHYRMVGLEITTAQGIYNEGVVRIGYGTETQLSQLPHTFEIDRVYVHGDPTVGSKRGIALNGINTNVQNSWISDFRSTSQDTQAVCGWNGPGPFTIENNYLEAAGENVFFAGGAIISGVTPSNIRILRNHIARPVAWRTATAPNGARWAVKNLLELKAGKQVLIEGNILENTWASAQVGYAINIKSGELTKDGPAITDGITIRNNIIRHAAGAVIIQGDNKAGGNARNVTIQNNLLDDINSAWGTINYIFTIAPNATGIVIENNTATATVIPKGVMAVDTATTTGFVFRSNILPHGTYGIKGSGYATGRATLDYYWPGHVFEGNIFFDTTTNPALYPLGTYMAAKFADLGLTENYTLPSTSLYFGKGVNGTNPGADYPAISSTAMLAATGGR